MTGISDKACSLNKLVPNIKDRCCQADRIQTGRPHLRPGLRFRWAFDSGSKRSGRP